MVTRPGTLYKTPSSSRGSSPARTSTKPSPAASPNKNRRSPMRSTSKGRSPDRQARKSLPNTPQRGSGLRKTSASRSLYGLNSSHGSEIGSIERLDEDNNVQRIITSFKETEDNINVVVRVRPLSNKETKSSDGSIIQFPGNGQILVEANNVGQITGQKSKLFSYNVVFEPAATQEDVLQFSGMKRLIEMAVEGFRCTCFCYGQTGSGKTHTLTGPPGLFGVKTVPYSDKHGLIFRSFLYLFKLIQEQPNVHFILKASYLEIYNEKVIDLLNPGSARKPLAVRWSKKARGFFVENLFTVDCEELDDLIAVLEEGLRNRSIGRHNMNDFSSRSHTILTVYITSEQPAENGVFLSRSGKINFVDLAGSEMTKKTQSEGKTLEEANNINKSLMVLGYCISSLSDSKRRQSYIPYRDSKLTKLLADSLAGNGVTLMIACISPAKSNSSETLNTLRYAARAKKIRTKPIVLMDPREALILSLKREVTVLQSENEHLRAALNHYSESGSPSENRIVNTPPRIELDELVKLEGPQLVELVRLYMAENDTLRKENEELFNSREMLQRDHEVVCRENERLLKKLEEVNKSPLIPARPAFSAEQLNSSASSNIWTNSTTGQNGTDSQASKAIPDSIQKELDKRQLGSGGKSTEVTNRRRNSWDAKGKGIILGKAAQPNGTQSKISAKNERLQRRYSMAMNKKSNEGSDLFGSAISLTDEEEL